MTLLEIYNRVIYNIFGEAVNIPPSLPGFIRGANGLAAQAMREIMQKRNYWFMKMSTTIPVVASTASYDLPTDLKEIEAIQYLIGDVYSQNLIELNNPTAIAHFAASEISEQPMYFVRGVGNITLYPIPAAAGTLMLNYWGFLPRPSNVESTWNAHEDTLSLHAGEVVISMVSSRVASIVQDYNLVQFYSKDAQRLLEEFDNMDWSKKVINPHEREYNDF